MKRLVIVLLCVLTVFSLTSCFSEIVDEIEEEVEEVVEDVVEDVVEGAGELATKDISRGTITDGVYSNDFAGITFTNPDNWVYSTDEEISALMNNSSNIFDLSNAQEILWEVGVMYDMMVTDPTTNTNVGICYENTAVTVGRAVDETEYLELVKEQLGTQSTMLCNFLEIDRVKLGDGDYYRLVMEISYNGVDMKQAYYCRCIDKYMVSVTVTVTGNYTIEEIEAMFE